LLVAQVGRQDPAAVVEKQVAQAHQAHSEQFTFNKYHKEEL